MRRAVLVSCGQRPPYIGSTLAPYSRDVSEGRRPRARGECVPRTEAHDLPHAFFITDGCWMWPDYG
jgi:hypothetical protein